MKGRQMNKRKLKGRMAASLVMAFLMTWFMVLSCLAASDVEAEPEADTFTITVNAPTGESYEELAKTNVALDFYKIASAEKKDGGFFVFGDWDSAFSDVQKMWEDMVAATEDGNYPTAEEISSVTQALAKVVLDEKAAQKYDTGETQVILGQTVSVEPGFYMVVPHGADLTEEEYVIDSNGIFTTIAKGETETWHFSPMLVTVPVRGESEAGTVSIPSDLTEIETPEGVVDTLEGDEWTYDVSVVAKVGIDGTGIPLTIAKVLPVYEASEPATFIFEIKAESKNGNLIYNDVARVTVSKPYPSSAPKKIILKDRDGKNIELPEGCTVTVLEKYSGTSYKPEGENPVSFVLSAENNTVTFTNIYTPTGKSGGSVENRVYLADDSADASGFEWKIEQVTEE